MSTAEEVSRIMALADAYNDAICEYQNGYNEYTALESAITAIVERAEADRVDAERLDWLDKYAVIAKPGQPIRAAIDAARQENSHE